MTEEMKNEKVTELTEIEKKALKMNAISIAQHYSQYDNGNIYQYTLRRLLESSHIELTEEEKKYFF